MVLEITFIIHAAIKDIRVSLVSLIAAAGISIVTIKRTHAVTVFTDTGGASPVFSFLVSGEPCVVDNITPQEGNPNSYVDSVPQDA